MSTRDSHDIASTTPSRTRWAVPGLAVAIGLAYSSPASLIALRMRC
jgi:hypothetical protein